jgi:hypothetical protein
VHASARQNDDLQGKVRELQGMFASMYHDGLIKDSRAKKFIDLERALVDSDRKGTIKKTEKGRNRKNE